MRLSMRLAIWREPGLTSLFEVSTGLFRGG
jgi:hypothetical protein